MEKTGKTILVIGACPVKCEFHSPTKALLSYFTGRTGLFDELTKQY